MIAAGGLLLALICITALGIAAALAAATWGTPAPGRLAPVLRTLTLTIAAGCLLLAALHQLTGALS
ncbi:hypothetical protein [Streptomyces sp. NPDC017941]|uniref:hypothetical protein n=1 Tax=Streptomyces sp. NPDC017941 TaxID=3365018 RepID=UPI0037B36723